MSSKNFTFVSSRNTLLYENNENSLTAEKNFSGSGIYITPTKNVPGRPDDITGCVLTALNSKGKCIWTKPSTISSNSAEETEIDISIDDLLDSTEELNNNDTIIYDKKTETWKNISIDSFFKSNENNQKQKRFQDLDTLGIIVKSVKGIRVGGSPVLPGGLLNINVDETVLLTKDDQEKKGILKITDETESSNSNNGCLVLKGGLGIEKNINCDGNINVSSLTTKKLFYDTTVTVINDSEGAVYVAEDLIGGIINRDCSGSDRLDTVDYAENIIGLIPNVRVGTTFDCYIRNTSKENNKITFEGGDDVVLDPGTIEIEQNEVVHLLIRVENIDPDNEFVTIYIV